MRCRRWAAVTMVVLFGSTLVTIDGGEVAGATVPRASSGVVATTRAARDLLAYVPTAVRGRCTDSDVSFDDQQYPQAIVTSYSAELDCTTAAGEEVFYTKFDNRAGADALLGDHRHRRQLRRRVEQAFGLPVGDDLQHHGGEEEARRRSSVLLPHRGRGPEHAPDRHARGHMDRRAARDRGRGVEPHPP